MSKYTAEQVEVRVAQWESLGTAPTTAEMLRDYAAHLRERESSKAWIPVCSCCGRTDTLETKCVACGEIQTIEAVAPMLSARVPDGYVLVPEKFGIPADAWHAAQFAFGGPGTGNDEPFMDCTAWIGDITGDDGEKIHGIHIWCDECPEEGSITLGEFSAAPKRGEG